MGLFVSYLSKSVTFSHPFSLTKSYNGVPGKGVATWNQLLVVGRDFLHEFDGFPHTFLCLAWKAKDNV